MTNASAATKRWIAVGGLAATLLLVVVLGLGASGDGGDSYRVRAIFDTASFLVPGEDVKVAGVKVGAIESLAVTKDNKAAIVLDITDPAFQDFKRDASCTIRLQSLIGEKYIACKPTQPKPSDAPPVRSLHRIRDGENEGQYLLPVENTSSPVDVDLLSNIMRAPQRQRLAIIINELGVGLAGNGEELRRVIRRANPAFKEFDRVLAILASQNRVLADLARDSDRALAATAREADSIATFVDKAGETATATAERGEDLEASFEKFPGFLEELIPTNRRLGELAAAGTPVMADLRAVAPQVSQLFRQLGPFSKASLPTIRTLGDASDVARRALVNAEPVIEDLDALGRRTKPLARSAARGLTDLQEKFGIERLLDVILFTTMTTNGFDEIGHYLRSYLVVQGQCLEYETTQENFFGCGAKFARTKPPAPATSAGDVATSATTADSTAPLDAPAEAPTSSTTGGAQAGLLDYLLGSEDGR
jgi:phospholipid/cholesterol/gamma-HCH transport system substrate-binding protein